MSENLFFLISIGICYFHNRPFCTFRQNVATLECLVRSSYPQMHGIVNLIQILQGGLEIVLLSWRTLPLIDLHSAEHLCIHSLLWLLFELNFLPKPLQANTWPLCCHILCWLGICKDLTALSQTLQGWTLSLSCDLSPHTDPIHQQHDFPHKPALNTCRSSC